MWTSWALVIAIISAAVLPGAAEADVSGSGPDETAAHAFGPLTFGTPVSGAFIDQFDVDYLRFKVASAGETLDFTLANTTASCADPNDAGCPIYLTLMDSSGLDQVGGSTSAAGTIATAGGTESFAWTFDTPDTYNVLLESDGDLPAGVPTYTVTVLNPTGSTGGGGTAGGGSSGGAGGGTGSTGATGGGMGGSGGGGTLSAGGGTPAAGGGGSFAGGGGSSAGGGGNSGGGGTPYGLGVGSGSTGSSSGSGGGSSALISALRVGRHQRFGPLRAQIVLGRRASSVRAQLRLAGSRATLAARVLRSPAAGSHRMTLILPATLRRHRRPFVVVLTVTAVAQAGGAAATATRRITISP